jgi:hypothetical protein
MGEGPPSRKAMADKGEKRLVKGDERPAPIICNEIVFLEVKKATKRIKDSHIFSRYLRPEKLALYSVRVRVRVRVPVRVRVRVRGEGANGRGGAFAQGYGGQGRDGRRELGIKLFRIREEREDLK